MLVGWFILGVFQGVGGNRGTDRFHPAAEVTCSWSEGYIDHFLIDFCLLDGILTLVLSSLWRIQSESHHELVNRFRGGRFLYQSFSLPYASDKVIVELSMNQKLLAKMNSRILVR